MKYKLNDYHPLLVIYIFLCLEDSSNSFTVPCGEVCLLLQCLSYTVFSSMHTLANTVGSLILVLVITLDRIAYVILP
jgi:hypothetical protein